MRLSISNIAWPLEDEPDVARLLQSLEVDRVDVAPGKYFPDPEAATASEIAAIRRLWSDRGFTIEGMQALLFGTQGLNLFDDGDDVMLRRLIAVCRIGGGLGARALTFGSPRQRDCSGLSPSDALDIARRFFTRLGDAAADEGVIVCLEPNPVVYASNFMTTTPEAAAVVRAVDHPSIRLQFDVGACALNHEDVADIAPQVADLIGHIHASEPMLATLGDGASPHEAAAAALGAVRPDLTVTIEMAAAADRDPRDCVTQAVAVAQRTYGRAG